MAPVRIPVLIIGGGGCGLTASSMLSNYGVEHVLLESHPGTSILPKAHVLNQRTAEILDQHNVWTKIKEQGCRPEDMKRFRIATSLGSDGITLGNPSVFGCNSDDGEDGDYNVYKRHSAHLSSNLPLIRLEPILRDEAEARNPGRILFNHNVVSFKESDDSVTVDAINRTTGSKVQYVADYVIAADGGKTVGPALGVKFDGPRDIADVTGVHFKADLSKYWQDGDLINFIVRVGNREGSIASSTGLFAADWTGVAQMGPTWGKHSEEFTMNLSFGQSHQPLESYSNADLAAEVRRVLGIPDLQVEILKTTRWHIEGVYATQYQTNRIFLAGDAAHRHPPTTGLGLNTAVGDVDNLTWKLAAVLKGQASPAVLRTYEAERLPIGRRNAQWALFTFMHFRLMDTAVGLMPGGPEMRAINEKLLEQLCSDTFDGAARRASVARAIENHRVEYAAHDLELGGVYTTGALVPDGTTPPPVDPRGQTYTPVARPGHRLPHAWLQGSQRISTHQLVGNKGSWALLTDDSKAGKQWIVKAASIESKFGLKIKAVRIGPAGDFQDEDGQWFSDSGLAPSKGGAVLVRPDTYVAFRAVEHSEDALARFEDAFTSILERSG
ncbi:FAD binding domain-containing protein [Biscogniauxia marginata]|nr:FAD binding domain-containing protein [Biscogniauxia marginata]